MERLRPLNDFIFKKLFGEPESKENLRAFLNAILYNNIGNIKDIEIIKDKELTTDEITNKIIFTFFLSYRSHKSLINGRVIIDKI